MHRGIALVGVLGLLVLAGLSRPAARQGLGAGVAAPATLRGAGAGRPKAQVGTADTPMFHGDRARTGWNPHETILTPSAVASPAFGQVWSSPQLDSATVTVKGVRTIQPPHLYATPLYIDHVLISGGAYAGSDVGVVFAATGAGYVYAIKAFDTVAPSTIPAGTILWRTFLGAPSAGPDGGVALGVLGTPVIDATQASRLYVASDVTDAGGRNWKVFALDLGSGQVLPTWPLTVNDSTLSPIIVNGPAQFQGAAAMSQRGALNLSADGHTLYVPFGAYGDGGTGYLVAVDTVTPHLASAFAGAPSAAPTANAGMWGAGGPAIDGNANVFDTTGNSPVGSGPAPGIWGNSLLEFKPSLPLALNGTYSPWNYCQMDQFDTDLGGSSPIVLPLLDPRTTSTPALLAIGGKQGNAYLLDGRTLPGRVSARPPCSTDPSSDRSLLPPGRQPQFGMRGPLNIFGPYSEDVHNQSDFAKARTTPAYFRNAIGTSYVFYAGSTKVAVAQRDVRPPSLVRVRVVTSPGKRAYYVNDAQDSVLRLLTPGSPLVTSNGSATPIVWVLDANVFRTAPLLGSTVPHPVLYAIDATTMGPLWSSSSAQLSIGGKYSHPTVARGVVMVGTDRITAFGLRARAATITTTTGDTIRAATIITTAGDVICAAPIAPSLLVTDRLSRRRERVRAA